MEEFDVFGLGREQDIESCCTVWRKSYCSDSNSDQISYIEGSYLLISENNFIFCLSIELYFVDS